jgi:hypothetical protein
LLTDGDVSYPEGVLKIIYEYAKPDVRFYSIGIGDGCSQYLIKKTAELGSGKYEFVSDNEELSEKVISLLEKAMMPPIE